ncbi:MAG: PHB depolymerase family esterase [Bacteroidia bacterium]|nr:PHB depolymerase family esterase [Bacteroidia bacterium]
MIHNCTTVIVCVMFSFFPMIAKTQTQIDSLFHDNIWRYYRIHVPAVYSPTKAVPLIINMHGLGSNGFEEEFYTRFSLISDTAGFIVVYPEGVQNAWNAGFVLGGTDDLGFISSLIDRVAASYSIDPASVYATGMSNGGFMSHYLGCELADRIAAIASVAGSMTVYVQGICDPGRAVPVLHIHGTNDQVVPYNSGNLFYRPVETVMSLWRENNQCQTADSVLLPDKVNEGSTVTRFDYGECADSSEVILYRVNNGGHTWPGALFLLPNENTNQDIDASLEIWEFFSRHQHPNPRPFSTTALEFEPETSFRLFPNPFQTSLNIEMSLKEETQVEVFSVSGKCFFSTQYPQGQEVIRLNTQEWPEGVCLVKIQTPSGVVVCKVIKY